MCWKFLRGSEFVSVEFFCFGTPGFLEICNKSSFLFLTGLGKDQAIKFACQMGFGPNCVEPAADIFVKLYNLFIEKDCTLVEINPLTEVSSGEGILSSSLKQIMIYKI